MPGDFEIKFNSYKMTSQQSGVPKEVQLIQRAILSVFDGKSIQRRKAGGNEDGVIDEIEFKRVSEAEYRDYVKEMENYYKRVFHKELAYYIPSYVELEMLLDTEKIPDWTNYSPAKKITKNEITEFIIPDDDVGQTKQGGSGDCYLEDTLIAMSLSKEGQELLKKSKKSVNNGYYITLYGAEINGAGQNVPIGSGIAQKPKTYFISQKTLKKAQKEKLPNGTKKYNYGDPDMTLFAVAVERYRKDSQSQPLLERNRRNIKGYDDYLSSGFGCTVMQLITGKKAVRYCFKKSISPNSSATSVGFNIFERKFSVDVALQNLKIVSGKTAKTCMFATTNEEEEQILKKYGLISEHEYAIKSINLDKQTVELINPWRGKRKTDDIKIVPFSDFSKVIANLSCM